ncbi:MAG: hypothetical protein ABH875_02270 [Candidatus Omnitrophota bacterium]
MTVKNMIINYKKKGNDFDFIRMDTLIERLRRMRALNSTPANIGLTQYTWKSCGIHEGLVDKKSKLR